LLFLINLRIPKPIKQVRKHTCNTVGTRLSASRFSRPVERWRQEPLTASLQCLDCLPVLDPFLQMPVEIDGDLDVRMPKPGAKHRDRDPRPDQM
jgi:hypothetical protein